VKVSIGGLRRVLKEINSANVTSLFAYKTMLEWLENACDKESQNVVQRVQEAPMYDPESYEPPVSAEDVLDGEELNDYRRSKAAQRVSRMTPDPHDPDWFEHAMAREMAKKRW